MPMVYYWKQIMVNISLQFFISELFFLKIFLFWYKFFHFIPWFLSIRCFQIKVGSYPANLKSRNLKRKNESSLLVEAVGNMQIKQDWKKVWKKTYFDILIVAGLRILPIELAVQQHTYRTNNTIPHHTVLYLPYQ